MKKGEIRGVGDERSRKERSKINAGVEFQFDKGKWMEAAGVLLSLAGPPPPPRPRVEGPTSMQRRTLYTEPDEYLELIWQQKSRGRPWCSRRAHQTRLGVTRSQETSKITECEGRGKGWGALGKRERGRRSEMSAEA